MAENGQIIANFTPPTISAVTVPFAELEPKDGGSPIITVDGDGGGTRYERSFEVAAADAYTFIRQALGFSYVLPGPPPLLRRYLPLFDPVSPWLPALRCTRAVGLNWKGQKYVIQDSPRQSILVYDRAKVTVEFGEVDYPIVDDATVDRDATNGEFLRYVTFTRDSSVDYLSIPTQAQTIFQWSDGPDGPVSATFPSATGPKPVPDTPGKTLPGETWHFRWRRIPYLYAPHATILDTLGKVNKVAFAGAPIGTLLFIARDQELRKQTDGSWALDLMYTMKYFPTGWNNVFDWLADPMKFYQIAVGGAFQTPGAATNGKLIYDERDFYKLFKVQA